MLPRPSRAFGALLATALFVQVTTCCLSNEYVIPQTELQRVAAQPPESRGASVALVQKLGSRRADAIEAEELQPPQGDVVGHLHVDASGSWPGGGGGDGARPELRGSPTSGAPSGAGWRGAPPSGGFHGKPPSGGSSGGGFSLGGIGGGGGGGGNDGAVLVVVAVVAVTAALVGTMILASGEGMRFDGQAQIPPEQPVHLKDDAGRDYQLPLGAVTPELAAHTVEAKVMDDEWYGLRRLARAPLDRTGGAFRFELGTSAFNYGDARVLGPAAHIQVGGFLTRNVGILGEIGLSGASGCCAGPDGAPAASDTIVRHSLAVELDLMPVALGRLHAGLFGKGGFAIAAGGASPWEVGPLGGGGALLEVDLTTRMALAFRAGANTTHLPSGWSTADTFTAGISIY